MTLTPEIATTRDDSAEPEFIEHLFQERGFKALLWTVGEPQRVDPDDPDTQMIADLVVFYSNGRRRFQAAATLDLDTIYGLVGSDDITQETADFAMGELLSRSQEADEQAFREARRDESWAATLGEWQHSDADLIRAAALCAPPGWAALLAATAPIVEGLQAGASFTSPEVQLAAVAVQVAWDLL